MKVLVPMMGGKSTNIIIFCQNLLNGNVSIVNNLYIYIHTHRYPPTGNGTRYTGAPAQAASKENLEAKLAST